MEIEICNRNSMKNNKRYSRYQKPNSEITVLDDESQEREINTELLHVIRNKLRQVNYSIEYERDNFALLDENGYLCKKGTLEAIDKHCIIYDIYTLEDRTDSLNQIIIEKQMQKYFGALLAKRKVYD